MLRWAEALDSGRLAGVSLAKAMQTPGRLITGEPLTYGMGLESWTYRGTPIVLHGGTGSGYRSQTMRFPALGAAISVLCNRVDANPDALVRNVADAWLGDRLAAKLAYSEFGPAHRAAAGDYIREDGSTFSLRFDGNKATAEGLTGEPLRASGSNEFEYETGQRPARLQIGSKGKLRLIPGQGRSSLYTRYDSVKLGPKNLQTYLGSYFNSDYQATLRVELDKGELRLIQSSGLIQPLRATTADRFMAGRGAALTFERQGSLITRFIFSTPRARRVVFERVR
jgi:hypothetical protein